MFSQWEKRDNSEWFKELYETTLKNKNEIINEGYNFIEIWDHDFNNIPSIYKPEIKPEDLPMRVRDALLGGRTETFMSLVPSCEGTYLDVCSLYPWVMSTCSSTSIWRS